jgi:integrase
MPKLTKKLPSYRLHKRSGQAVVTLNGTDHYLGDHDSPESKTQYEQLMSQWLASHRQLPPDESLATGTGLTINEVFLAYWEHAQVHYRKNGRPTSQVGLTRLATRPLVELYGKTPISTFGPLALKTVRERMVKKNISLSVINKYVGIIRRMFKWATENELVPPSVYHGLQTVRNLQKGRSNARETDPVEPVPQAHIDAVLPFVSRQMQSMIQLQLVTGMRPGEVRHLRGCDLDTSGKLWVYRPDSHKTEHHGRKRVIYLGPKAQEIVRPYLNRDLAAYLFSPRDAVEERNIQRKTHRKSPMTPSQARRKSKRHPKRTAGEFYGKESYRTAIHRACDKAGVPRWRPNQLRHNAATNIV